MRQNREHLAWVILLAAFFTCISMVVLVPLGGRWYVLNAQVPQPVTLEVQPGPLSVTRAGRGKPEYIVENLGEVPEGTIVRTEGTAGRLVVLTSHDSEAALATVQLYDNTKVTLTAARSPRFGASPLANQVMLRMESGRVRVGVPAGSNGSDPETVVEVETPYGLARLFEGSHEVKVNGRTDVIVRDGRAELETLNQGLVELSGAERAYSDGDRLCDPLPAERNLLANGDFQDMMDVGWQPYSKDVQQEPPGAVEVITSTDRLVAWFHREGIGHAEVGLRQEINYDVRDFSSLLLHLNVQVRGQSLPGCGSLGSECPIIARIDYKDVHGNDREWYHGFYSAEQAADDLLHPWDEHVPLQTWYAYDSGNLIELMSEPPAYIKALYIYASGHSFDALVTEVELLAQE